MLKFLSKFNNQTSAVDNGGAVETKAIVPSVMKNALKSRWRLWLGLGLTVGMGGGAIALWYGWNQLEASIPANVTELTDFARPGTMTIEAADGTVIQEVGPVNHEKLKIWQIPKIVTQAFIASEDSRFYDHEGVDLQGVMRASVTNVRAGKIVEGGSSITQQLARITFLDQEQTLGRKLKEMRLAQKIEEKFDKNQILENYLNFVYLGSGAYGIADAAWIYFSKPVDKLTLPEAAMIAGVTPAPSDYSPFENQQAAKERRDIVLRKMAEAGYITSEQAESAIATPINTKRSEPKRLQRQFPYFTDYIQSELKQRLTPAQLEQGGLVVETTINPQWQKIAEEKVAKVVELYGRYQRFSQAALTTIDPRNGQIKVMVGGDDFENNQYNRVTQAQRQPGSTFKTFVYATAIAGGMSPYQSYLDADYVINGYHPENYGDKYSNSYVSIHNALTKSVNVVAVRTLVDTGIKPVIEMAKRMGIKSELQSNLSLALGSSEVNLLELTSAYGTLANKGLHQEVSGINRILDRHGKVIYQAKTTPERAIDEESAAIMTWMLRSVVTSGTGGAAQIGRPVAGKTGTSDKARDLWFVGYIPQLVTGVWLGNDDNKYTWGASSTSAMLWGQFMREIDDEIPVESFPEIPANLSGRKGTIKLEPIKGTKTYYKRKAIRTNNGDSNTESHIYRSNLRSRRDRTSTNNNSTSGYSRRNRTESKSTAPTTSNITPKSSNSGNYQVPKSSAPVAPKAPVVTPPSLNKPSKAPKSAPVPPPVTDVAPPAPPAARKEE